MERHLEYEKAFGENVKRLRELRKLSQADLAFLAGVEQNQISRVENAKHGVTLSTIIALAVALGYKPGELFQLKVELELNSDFDVSSRKRLPITATLQDVLTSDFLETPQSVKEIIDYCTRKYSIALESASVSGALKSLSKRGLVKRIPASKRGKFLYQK